jgi:hypothetical protein
VHFCFRKGKTDATGAACFLPLRVRFSQNWVPGLGSFLGLLFLDEPTFDPMPMAALLYMMVEHRRIRVWRRPAMELIHLFDTCRERVQYLNKLNIGPPKV